MNTQICHESNQIANSTIGVDLNHRSPVSRRRKRTIALARGLMSLCLVLGTAKASKASAQRALDDTCRNNLPNFEVATIRPGAPDERNHSWNISGDLMVVRNYSVRELIKFAYGVKGDSQVLGGPPWLDTLQFDITAKIDEMELAKLLSMSDSAKDREWRSLVRSLLIDRFSIETTEGIRTMPVYALVTTSQGSKLVLPQPLRAAQNVSGSNNPGSKPPHSISFQDGHLKARAISMDSFAESLTQRPEVGTRVVLNRTGLVGDFTFDLCWHEDRTDVAPPLLEDKYSDLFSALQKQLGLKLQSQRGSIRVVIVGSAAHPDVD
jgi:uncharacterized protein (TIGR03435 family)